MIEFARHIMNALPGTMSLQLFKFAILIKNRKQIEENKKLLKKYASGKEIDSSFYENLNEYCAFGSHVGADLYIMSYFGDNKIKPVSLKAPQGDVDGSDDVIMICCVKNDLERVRRVVSHHREIGISRMVFVDNMSTDGTREYLEGQPVDLYTQDEAYHAGRKGSWIRQVQDIYGYDRWYLIVDSDELFTYAGMEEHKIQELIRYARSKNVVRVRSMLLDMYPDHELYQKQVTNDGIYSFDADYRFFDCDSYYEAKDGRGYMVRGGPRKRCFESELDHSEPLTKYPLIFAAKEDVWDDHRPLPYYKNFQSINVSVLRHYKFMEGDLEKYRMIAQEGRYYNNSANYKIYVDNGNRVNFCYENSAEYESSKSLNKLSFLESIKW